MEVCHIAARFDSWTAPRQRRDLWMQPLDVGQTASYKANMGTDRVVLGLENANTLGAEVHLADRQSLRQWQKGNDVVHCNPHIQRLMSGLPSHCSEIDPRRRCDWVFGYPWSTPCCWGLHFWGGVLH